MAGRRPRAHLWQIGCQMNQADRDRLAEQLQEIGIDPESRQQDADLVILLTCAVRQNAEQKVYGKFKELSSWKAERPGRAIALTGCMAVEHGEQLLQRLPGLDYMFDVREPEGFLSKLQDAFCVELDGPMPLPASDRLTAYVPVIGGCNEMCTYCIVPFVRGRETSRPLQDVVQDVARLVERGVREITLLGQNVNSYVDPASGVGLAGLMRAVDRVPGLLRQRFLTSHPRNAVPELFSAMGELVTACEQLHLPVQSGSNSCLARMKRLYSVEQYKEQIALARSMVPGLAISTDIIVGFPGETDEEFEETVQLMQEIKFDVVHMQAYSPRPGTAAARRSDDVPMEEKKRRLARLLSISRDSALAANLAQVGRVAEVLVERLPEEGSMGFGRTRQNRVVRFSGTAKVGTLASVQLQSATVSHLVGTVTVAPVGES